MTDPRNTLFFAGPLQVLYENGFIRRISYNDLEIIRMIYFAVRDENWTTLPLKIHDLEISHAADNFKITYNAISKKNGNNVFAWNTVIHGNANGQITFELRGEALVAQKKNRAGFCVLHPLRGLVGQPVTVIHADQEVTKSIFPINVSAENPFKNIHSLVWESFDMTFELVTEGDVFETEDQRNWTDASYKTFCTPSHHPVPVTLKKGEKVIQKITFRPVSKLISPMRSRQAIIHLEKSGGKSRLPLIGVSASSEHKKLTPINSEMLQALLLDHYRIEVTPSKAQWVSDYSMDYQDAFSMSLPLFVVLHLGSDYKDELNSFIALTLQNRVNVKYVLVLSNDKPVTEQSVIDHINKKGKSQLPKVLWGAGTDFNFNDINANRFTPAGLDFVSYAIHPQEHTFDDLSLIENLEGQSETAKTAAHIYPSLNICVSPVTLRKRFNPAASHPAAKKMTEEDKSDPRQLTAFNARWTFGSFRSLAEGQVRFATYFQTVGRQGLLSTDNTPYPVYDILRKLIPFRDKEMVLLKTSHPHLIDAMLFEHEENLTLWIVNHSEINQTVVFEERRIDLRPGEIKIERSDRT
jgi:hypothetical protein